MRPDPSEGWRNIVAVIGAPVLMLLCGPAGTIDETLYNALLFLTPVSSGFFALWRSVTWPGRHTLAYVAMGVISALLASPSLGRYVHFGFDNGGESTIAAVLLLTSFVFLFVTGGLVGDAIKFFSGHSMAFVPKNSQTGTDGAPMSPQGHSPARSDEGLKRFSLFMTAIAPILGLLGTVISAYLAYVASVSKP